MTADDSRKKLFRNTGVRIGFLVILIYCGVAIVFASLQRSMIYASRPGPVEVNKQWVESGRLKEVEVSREDGELLHGWWLRAIPTPSSEIITSKGIVILFPGNAGNRSGRIEILDDFNRCGWDAMIFDYRGYADNPGSPSEEAFASDARSIWEYATGKLGYSADHIVLAGQSLGGGVATRLAWDLKKEGISPGGLILRATFTSLTDIACELYPWLPVRWILLDRYPSIERIGELDCPILIVHGTLDTITPVSHGHALFAAAPEQSATGIPKTFIELPHCGHNDLQIVAKDELHLSHFDFLSKIHASRSGVSGEVSKATP